MNDIQTIYLAGPMRNIPEYNWPAFDLARDCLATQGYVVVSPADLDRERGFSNGTLLEELAAADVRKLFTNSVSTFLSRCDAIALMPGWKKSRGAVAEKTCADAVGIPAFIYDHGTLWPYADDEPDGDLLEEAIDITNGARQASYGSPDKDFDNIARRWSIELEHKLLPGMVLDAIDVGKLMIQLKLARDQFKRKFDNLRDIAGYTRCIGRIFLSWSRRMLGGPLIPRGTKANSKAA